MIRIVVAEDEPLPRQHLVDRLRELPGVEVVAAVENGRLALAALQEHKPDALFLDIEMPGIPGNELMHMLPDPQIALVFVTGNPGHAVEAFAAGAVHYLLKPVSRVDLAQAVARIRPLDGSASPLEMRIPARFRGGIRLLFPSELDALVADLGDCMAWTSEGKLPVDGSLAHWESRLTGHGFLRVHRAALVRLQAVTGLSAEEELILPTGRIPLSRRRAEDVKRLLGL